ncbi:hypothetical protein B6V75_06890 [Thioclava sp. F1Mire-8]|nr:hypothetical protein B6V75_06890 [Thioclava sp. F1Mire-8]
MDVDAMDREVARVMIAMEPPCQFAYVGAPPVTFFQLCCCFSKGGNKVTGSEATQLIPTLDVFWCFRDTLLNRTDHIRNGKLNTRTSLNIYSELSEIVWVEFLFD